MASLQIQRSSSSHTKNFDVFVSFRGEDTRYGFTNHLFAALQRKGVVAFRDDLTIKKGEFLESELLSAIEGSRVFIVVFSKDYASSTWCMKELTKIVDWVEETGRNLLPIFYDVTPSEVRKQNGEFAKAFAEHEERFKDDLEMINKWREALKASTDRCGWDIKNKQQNKEIENIVEEVINILGHNQILSFRDDLVDMHSRVKQLEELLDLSANDVVHLVGICGMGGIGKTTLATALFNKISDQYNACCYIDDLSKIYSDFGVTVAQKQLLCQALNQENMKIQNLSHGTMLIRTRLCRLKTLVVLDNVDQIEQLENLALYPEYLGTGSRIIIISRDCNILQNYGVNKVYNVQLLDETHGLQLLCKKAFKSNHIKKEYVELTYDVLTYVRGLPLAIKILGSFLHNRDVCEWRSALARMKENPRKDIMDVLRISFDGLESAERNIFLDLACFLSSSNQYRHKKQVKKFLNYRNFYPDIGLKVLIEKSLINIQDEVIKMHDLLKELGKSIVREKTPKKPTKWSRLWDYKDFQEVMKINKESKNLQAIVIEQFPEEFLPTRRIRVDGLSKINHLELLILKNVKFSGTLNCISNELRYLSWNYFPFMSLPSTFHPNELVELKLPYSSIKKLWEGTKELPNLEILDLSHSKNLIEMPDLKGVPRLTDLNLEGCIEVVQIDPSIGTLRELVSLNLKNCKNLVGNLHILFELSSVTELNLFGCSKLLNSKLLMESSKPEDSLGLLLPCLSRFRCLSSLNLSFCNLLQIPDIIGTLHCLVELDLGGNKFVTLPSTIKQLSKLQYLNLEHCKQLKYLPELPITKENRIREYFWQLYIFDCPKLSDMEHCYSMVISWMTQNLEVCLKPSISSATMTIVIPGTQIPKWFNKQNAGSSITADSSAVMDDPNWIGVACCVLFATEEEDPTNLDERSHNGYCIQYGVNMNEFQRSGILIDLPIHFEKDLVTVELDHLLTVFYSREDLLCLLARDLHKIDLKFFTRDLHKIDLKFFTRDLHEIDLEFFSYSIEGLRVVIKNCGYRWLFKEDLQQLNPNMMFGGNFSSRKRKLLTSD